MARQTSYKIIRIVFNEADFSARADEEIGLSPEVKKRSRKSA